jgi:hypothetical protein
MESPLLLGEFCGSRGMEIRKSKVKSQKSKWDKPA